MGTKLKVAADTATCLEYDDRALGRKPIARTCTACAYIGYLRLLRLTGLAQGMDELVGAAGGAATAGVALEYGGDVLDALAQESVSGARPATSETRQASHTTPPSLDENATVR